MSSLVELSEEKREFLLIQYRESYNHYRHLETLRSAYLAVFFTVNTLAFSVINRSAYPATSVIALLDFSAFLFYVMTRVNESVKDSHLRILLDIQKEFEVGELINVKFQNNLVVRTTALFQVLGKIKLASTATLFPAIYLTMMICYLSVAALGLKHIHFQTMLRFRDTLFVLMECGIVLGVCSVDFISYFYGKPAAPKSDR